MRDVGDPLLDPAYLVMVDDMAIHNVLVIHYRSYGPRQN
jgi:hypothetical protein